MLKYTNPEKYWTKEKQPSKLLSLQLLLGYPTTFTSKTRCDLSLNKIENASSYQFGCLHQLSSLLK